MTASSTTPFPSTAVFDHAKPKYIEVPGWQEDITGCKSFDELPQAVAQGAMDGPARLLDPAGRPGQPVGQPLRGPAHGGRRRAAAVAGDRDVLGQVGEETGRQDVGRVDVGWGGRAHRDAPSGTRRAATSAAVRAISLPTTISPSSTPIPGLASTCPASHAMATCADTCAERSVSAQVPPQ